MPGYKLADRLALWRLISLAPAPLVITSLLMSVIMICNRIRNHSIKSSFTSKNVFYLKTLSGVYYEKDSTRQTDRAALIIIDDRCSRSALSELGKYYSPIICNHSMSQWSGPRTRCLSGAKCFIWKSENKLITKDFITWSLMSVLLTVY